MNDGVDLTMAFIEGGSFLMGSSTGNGVDLPAHNVDLGDFWIGRFEVTADQYSAVMLGTKRVDRYAQGPVNVVRWREALEFCERVSERTGWDFKLPTEAQWEYACRAGSTTRFYFGDDERKLGDYAWYKGNKSMWREHGGPRDVGQKRPNDWGLYDMHGNVWEWCLDRFESDHFKERDKDPEDKKRYEKRGLTPRVMKGGAAWNTAVGCRSASRQWTYENAAAGAGFRVVAMPPDDEDPPAGAQTSSDPSSTTNGALPIEPQPANRPAQILSFRIPSSIWRPVVFAPLSYGDFVMEDEAPFVKVPALATLEVTALPGAILGVPLFIFYILFLEEGDEEGVLFWRYLPLTASAIVATPFRVTKEVFWDFPRWAISRTKVNNRTGESLPK